jgi:serine/threonine-protein kinase
MLAAARSRADFPELRGLGELLASIIAGKATPELAAILARAAEASRPVPRCFAFVCQSACEHRMLGGERAEALELLEAADGALLFDVNWMDRCPMLDDLRREPRFKAIRARVRERAGAGLRALA